MNHLPDSPEPITIYALLCSECHEPVAVSRAVFDSGHALCELCKAARRGAEPYWMQDIRGAQNRLESARRAASRAAGRSAPAQ